jgi:hypothetical protein
VELDVGLRSFEKLINGEMKVIGKTESLGVLMIEGLYG